MKTSPQSLLNARYDVFEDSSGFDSFKLNKAL